MAAAGANARRRKESFPGTKPPRALTTPSGTYRSRDSDDRPGVDGVEAGDELVGVAVGIVAGDVEKCLRDRQRGSQLVGGVGCEPLLLGHVCFEPGEHCVEGVGEFAELVLAARQPDPVR